MTPQIPGFEDLEQIGRGGFAVVYRARQVSVNRVVALKVLNSIETDDITRLRFEREAQALGALSGHPHIVEVYDAGFSPEGVPYLAMEYLEGGSVGERVRRDGALDWRKAVEAGRDVARALEAAHAVGLLHRDLKPDNVLIGRRGQIKLGDFGIAGVIEGSRSASAVLAVSVDHVAPEILDGVKASAAGDIYSLGSTIFEMVAGHSPFRNDPAESLLQHALRVGRSPVPTLSEEQIADLPQRVSDAVATMMSKVPSGRPQSAPATVELLEALVAGNETLGVGGHDASVAATTASERVGPDSAPSTDATRRLVPRGDPRPTVEVGSSVAGGSAPARPLLGVSPPAEPDRPEAKASRGPSGSDDVGQTVHLSAASGAPPARTLPSQAPMAAPMAHASSAPRRRPDEGQTAMALGIAALVVVLAIGAGAIVLIANGKADGGASSSSAPTTAVDVATQAESGSNEPSHAGVALTQLEVGDCWEAAGGENRFTIISCSESHNAQVFALFEFSDAQMNSGDRLRTAFDLCQPAFEATVDASLVDGRVDVLPTLPLGNNRTVACSLSTSPSVEQSLLR